MDAAVDSTPVTGTSQDRYALFGTIENATRGVRGSTGECIPSLAAANAANPITRGADARIFILRHPNMHGALDDVFTFDWPRGVSVGNNMGGGLFVSTAQLLEAVPPVLNELESGPHGVPWGGPNTELRAVSGGGEPCDP